MKKITGIILFFLCIAIILTVGCTSTGSTIVAPVATPTPQIVYVTVLVTPTPTPIVTLAQDPIIGVWRGSDSAYDYDDRIRINADGTFVESFYNSDSKATRVYYGTWSAQGSNTYIVKGGVGNSEMYIYDPARNGIYNTKYYTLLLTSYEGDVAAASSSASTPTYSSQSSSSSSTHFSGNGDDVQSFTATGSGLRIFTMRHTGNSNFAIELKDGNGKYVALLVNEIGSYSGKKSESLTSGKYYLDVTADGAWTIDVTSV